MYIMNVYHTKTNKCESCHVNAPCCDCIISYCYLFLLNAKHGDVELVGLQDSNLFDRYYVYLSNREYAAAFITVISVICCFFSACMYV